MQRWHVRIQPIDDILCNWCYMIWCSSEMVFLPMSVFPLHHDHVFQLFITAFVLSVKLRMKCILWDFKNRWHSTGTKTSFLLITMLTMDVQGRTSVQCSGLNCQHATLYGFNSAWGSHIWFQQEISQSLAMPKKSGWYHNARCHRKCDKVISNIDTTKTIFNFKQTDMWF